MNRRARRHVLRWAGAWLAAPVLSGCGFHLRRPPSLPFGTLKLVGFPARSPLTQTLKRTIEASGTTRVVESAAEAQVVLEAVDDVRDRTVAAQTASGQVREFTLHERLRFRAHTPAGKVLIPETELLLNRDLTYNESNALAKEQEAAALYRSMEDDIVDQLMRRLAAVPPIP